MGEIRAFAAEHAEEAATLLFRAMRGQVRPPGATLPAYLRELFLSNPWASPETPSLVYLEAGKVVGMIGVLPRPMEFWGEPMVAVTTTQFMVHPDHRGPAGVQLLRRVLRGPQDLTWTDGAADGVRGLWTALGGHTASLYGFNWIRVLRPAGTARSVLSRFGRAGRAARSVAGMLTTPADFLLSRLPMAVLREPESRYSAEPVAADKLLECIQEIGWRESLRPVYTQPSFSWLMQQVAQVRPGILRMIVVKDPEGARCGWVVYFAKRGESSIVLQIGAKRRDRFRGILGALFRDAWRQGAVCVKGASIPGHLTDLTLQHCVFRHPNSAVLVHSRDPNISTAIRLGEAAITRLDGECWLRFAGDQWP